MDTPVSSVVDAILTAILQWKVAWLDEQKGNLKPPPICRTEPRKLKITYDNYKDYESTFFPLLMHEIWAQIYEEWSKLEQELSGQAPMEVDDQVVIPSSSKQPFATRNGRFNRDYTNNGCMKQFQIGVFDFRAEGQFQCILRCQSLVESNKLSQHQRLIGEGDLVRLDLNVVPEPVVSQVQPLGNHIETQTIEVKKRDILSLFGYVVDVSSERVNTYSTVSECFVKRPKNNCHLVNYQVVIAKRPLKMRLAEPSKISGIYYLKPMIRQIESVAILQESALASDILCPKKITCQLSIPTVVSIKSPHYNDMQYKAIIGANEALVRSIPKIQLIQGPPGTGKTHTLIGIIKHFYTNWQETLRMPKILICAPSNGAIDEVARRLYKERDFLKKAPAKRSLRMVRVGHPDQISHTVKAISLEELIEANANHKLETMKKKHSSRVMELEDQLSAFDTEISNLRYMKREKEIPNIELKIARLLKELENSRTTEEVNTKREVSEASKKNMRYELLKNADVILTTLNSCQRHPLDALFKSHNSDLSFHCVIVDEASQCCEPELLMPLCYKIYRMILIGDPMQLPATVISRYAQDFDFGRSLFERFFKYFGGYEPSSPISMLTDQYRMHPDICHFPSKQFYDGRLVSARAITDTYPIKPYIMFDLMHSTEKKSDKASIENEVEASFVRILLMSVLTTAPENSKIGVITPYKGQKRLLTHKISSLQAQRNIQVDVNTCDGFQGQEKDIIILSCVRAFDGGGSVGFLKSFQRINVALTRARHSLIVCISARSLSKDKIWKALVDDAIDRRVLNTLTHTPTETAVKDMITSKHPIPTADSKLVRVSHPDNMDSSEPEYVIPMDID